MNSFKKFLLEEFISQGKTIHYYGNNVENFMVVRNPGPSEVNAIFKANAATRKESYVRGVISNNENLYLWSPNINHAAGSHAVQDLLSKKNISDNAEVNLHYGALLQKIPGPIGIVITNNYILKLSESYQTPKDEMLHKVQDIMARIKSKNRWIQGYEPVPVQRYGEK